MDDSGRRGRGYSDMAYMLSDRLSWLDWDNDFEPFC